MRDIVYYIEAAKARQDLDTDNQLAKRWHIRRQSVHDYREGLALPRGDKMLQLADLAGVEREIAWLEYQHWLAERERQGAASDTIRELLSRFHASRLDRTDG